MDKAVQLDKVLNDNLLNLFPVYKSSVLTYEVQILHQDQNLDLKFVLILHERVLDDNFPLDWVKTDFFLSIFLICVLNRANGSVICKERLVNEGRVFHLTVYLDD